MAAKKQAPKKADPDIIYLVVYADGSADVNETIEDAMDGLEPCNFDNGTRVLEVKVMDEYALFEREPEIGTVQYKSLF
jgi:hypothetical protein